MSNTSKNYHDDDLTANEIRFVDTYLLRNDIKAAAMAAGYLESEAQTWGNSLMQRPSVIRYLNHRRGEVNQAARVNRDQIVAELRRIAFTDLTDLVDEEIIPVDENGDVPKGVTVLHNSTEDDEVQSYYIHRRLRKFADMTPDQRACIKEYKEGRDGVSFKTYDKLAALAMLTKMQGYDMDKGVGSLGGTGGGGSSMNDGDSRPVQIIYVEPTQAELEPE